MRSREEKKNHRIIVINFIRILFGFVAIFLEGRTAVGVYSVDVYSFKFCD